MEKQSDLSAKWDAAAHVIDIDPMRNIRYAKAIRYFKNKDKKIRILDLGCGEGSGLLFLHSLGFKNLSGLEVSAERLKRAKQKLPENINLKFVPPQNQILPFDDNEFDIVISLAVIEHVIDPELLIKEIHRILKSGGHTVISSDCWQWRILQILGIYRSLQPIDKAMFPTKLLNLFKKNQLNTVHYEGFPLPNMKFRFIRELYRPIKRRIVKAKYLSSAIIRKLTFNHISIKIKPHETTYSTSSKNISDCLNETFIPANKWFFSTQIKNFLLACFSDENIFFMKKRG